MDMAPAGRENGALEVMVDFTQKHRSNLLCHPQLRRSGAATDTIEMTAPTPRRDHGHADQTRREKEGLRTQVTAVEGLEESPVGRAIPTTRAGSGELPLAGELKLLKVCVERTSLPFSFASAPRFLTYSNT